MKWLILLTAVFLTGSIAIAQSVPGIGKLSVIVLNEKQTALENATVELLRSKDSSLVKVAIPDKTGLAIFENIRFGSFIIKASMVNYSTWYSPVFLYLPNNLSTASIL